MLGCCPVPHRSDEEASRPLIMAEIQEEDTLCQLGVVEQKDMGGEDMGGEDMGGIDEVGQPHAYNAGAPLF